MSKYTSFIFKRWQFDVALKKLSLQYSYDDLLDFEETYIFDFDFTEYSNQSLERAIDTLFFMAGVSYYKAYLAPTIHIRQGYMDEAHAEFFSKTYQKGLGEFFYVNKMDPNQSISFPINNSSRQPLAVDAGGKLIGLGGGKDSLVSVELLKKFDSITTWTLGHRTQLEPLTQITGLPHIWVSRSWDSKLTEVNQQDALNGHVPLSAILACAGTVTAILSGKQDVVVSNERSANEPTLQYKGVSINHQYSKSSEFEQDYQDILKRDFGESIRYYSLLRPFSELEIAEMFAASAFDTYKSVFSSCNRAFVRNSGKLYWCGECSKCAFVYLLLAPFVTEAELIKLFGKNLLLDPALGTIYEQLLGINGEKPLECVGEIAESRWAMDQMKARYPSLQKFNYETTPINTAKHAEHSIPNDVYKILTLQG